jgi:hypothetical protein
VPTPVLQWSAQLLLELLPLGKKTLERPPAEKLGLLEWSPEIGLGEEFYKPDSFNLLSDRESPRDMTAHALDVTLRAVVMYKKNLRAKIPPVAPDVAQAQSMREARYEVELVVLEILRLRKLTAHEIHR